MNWPEHKKICSEGVKKDSTYYKNVPFLNFLDYLKYFEAHLSDNLPINVRTFDGICHSCDEIRKHFKQSDNKLPPSIDDSIEYEMAQRAFHRKPAMALPLLSLPFAGGRGGFCI